MTSNKMATMPVGRLIISMGLPAVFSMLIQALYNVVDTIYVSSYSKDAMFAIGLSTPFYMVGLSVALGGAAGICTAVSRKLGEKKVDEANKIASNGFTLTIIQTIIVVAFGYFLSTPFLRLFTERQEILELGSDYLIVVLCFCFGQQFAVYYERLFQAQGNMIIPMIAQLIGAITNIILDPIMIFGRYGCPEMGIVGAAVATVIGQVLSMVFLIIISFVKKQQIQPHIHQMKLEMPIVGTIYQVGIPTMIMTMISSVTTTSLNSILVEFSEDAVTSLSIYFKLQSFVFMPVLGFNQGALPILSFNYGAKLKQRYKDAIKYFLIIAEIFMVSGTLLFLLAPEIPLSFFDTDASLLSTAEMVLRTASLCFIFVGPNVAMTTIFQSFGQGTLSMIQSILRQLGFLVPAAYLLSKISLQAVFYAYPIAEGLMMLIAIPFAIISFKKHFADVK